MRLLKVDDLQLHEFECDGRIPPYAILSHTWGDGEVTFQEIDRNCSGDGVGLTKIKRAALEAGRMGLDYIWIDTCCQFPNHSEMLKTD